MQQQQTLAIDVYQKILKAQEQLQTQYQIWVNYGPNTGTGYQYAPRFAFLILPFHQAIIICKDLERMFTKKQEQISNLINLMEEIINSLHDNTLKFYTYADNTGSGTQMAGHLSMARNKAEDLRNRALTLTIFQVEIKGEKNKSVQHLKCPQNHWLQPEDRNTFTCSRQGCGTTYRNQNYVRVCTQCNFFVCENCIHHQQV